MGKKSKPSAMHGGKGSATTNGKHEEAAEPVPAPKEEDMLAVVAAVTTGNEEQDTNDAGVDAGVDAAYIVQVKLLAGTTVVSIPVNSGDTIMDIRQFLSEAPETCHATHYVLRHEGAEVNDFTEVAALIELQQATHHTNGAIKEEANGGSKEKKSECTVLLAMAEGCYDERSSKAHVRRLRQLMTAPLVTPGSAAFALLPVAGADGTVEASPLDELENTPPLDGVSLDASSLLPLYNFDFGHDLSYKDPQCLKSVTYSSFNPVPSNRRLQGDLAYYDVVLSDDRHLCVTASARGFFVNKSVVAGAGGGTALDAAHHDGWPQLGYTMVGLLSIISAAFKRNWAKLMQAHIARDPFESVPHHLTVTSWAALESSHTADVSRVEDTMSWCYGMETGSLTRDWNEEHQSCRELPMANRRERILRERTMFKISSDFVEAATQGAVAVIDRCIPPINPMDEPSAHMYVYNSIFFSYASPSKEAPDDADAVVAVTVVAVGDAATEEGLGDQATYASSNQDLIGVQMYSATETPGLYTLATAVIDYRGFRIVAQSIIPGILQGEQLGSLIYGSVDNGSKFVWNEDFHAKLSKAAALLHIKEHEIEDGAGERHRVCVPVECKGILGSDNRMYLLDLIRVTPKDPNFDESDESGSAGVLRTELLRNYYIHHTKMEASAQELKGAAAKVPVIENGVGGGSKEELKSADASEFAFNVNIVGAHKEGVVARAWKVVGEGVEADEAAVRGAGQLLGDKIIPSLVEQFKTLDISPVDGKQLTDAMHTQGINVRYLGALHTAAANVPYVRVLCEREMITRAVKHVLRGGLMRTGPSFLAASCAHVLNCLLGRVTDSKADKLKKKKTAASGKSGGNSAVELDSKGPLLSETSQSLWSVVQQQVSRRFKFTLGDDRHEILARVSPLPLLRAVCQRGGLQIRARELDLTVAHPLASEDILDIFPVTKGTIFQCKEGLEMLVAGKALMHMSNLHRAFEVLHEALHLLHHTCGPMHESTASAYSTLAMVYYHLGDYASALAYQQKGIVILEKIHGFDDPEVALGYGNMVLFSHCLHQNRRALLYMRRAEYLLRIIGGADHPDVAALYINTAMIYLDLNEIKTALRYLHRALTINESVLGSQHASTATTYHATAVALSMMKAAPLALKNQQRCHEILRDLYGDKDHRVIDSVQWLTHFTARSKIAQQSKAQIEEDISVSSHTLKPVVFAQGGVREAEKNITNGDVPSSPPPPMIGRGKLGAISGS
mmetsp:Transcript_922/g.1478  ORF Transcript_922/g.1478 Transcript_922/m.1478 type:complete len:1243 (+) Transcript_922:286-4014(+)